MELIAIGAIAMGSYCIGFLDGAQEKPEPKAKPVARPARRNRIKAGPVVVGIATKRRPQAIDPQAQQWSLEAQFKSAIK